ncbi:MAG: type II toxin-antitoxin system VapC family toxin [Anaerolineales bacterium]|nr:type II toxin-antitoxin system VapC family toxin [Anaerolineales bacterium]
MERADRTTQEIVIDSNLPVAQVIPMDYSEPATALLRAWKQAMIKIYAPGLWEYEVASAVRKSVYLKQMTTAKAEQALADIYSLGIKIIPATIQISQRALYWAEQINQFAAYDAQYLALAESLGADLWTADERLYKGAKLVGADWVHWIGESQ